MFLDVLAEEIFEKSNFISLLVSFPNFAYLCFLPSKYFLITSLDSILNLAIINNTCVITVARQQMMNIQPSFILLSSN